MAKQNWTEKQLKDLQKKNQIRSFVLPERTEKNISFNKMTKEEKRSKEKEWMEIQLQYWCNNHAVTLMSEFQFDQPSEMHGHVIPARLWRFDFCITAYKIAIEYEGIIAEKSRHTTLKGFSGDSQKYNRAQELGYDVLRFTALTYKEVIQRVEAIYQKRLQAL
jgi:very-short-patch-repair endonuclease